MSDDPDSFGANRFELVFARPDLDLTLEAMALDVCRESATVNLKTSQAGAIYTVLNSTN